MNYQVRELSPTRQPNSERANASSIHDAVELGDEELSMVSGGKLALVCANGRHITTGKITC
jgi:hypothetical protein